MSVATPSRLGTIAFVLLVVAVGAAGLWAGRTMQEREIASRLDLPAPATHGLELGSRFPGVALVAEDGTPVAADSLWRERGAVVLFLDPECAPCGTMVERWDALAQSDSLTGLALAGITYAAPPTALRAYRAKHGVSFPVFADTAAAFLRDHGVTNVPLVAIVGRSGTLHSTTFDPEEPIHAAELLAALSR